VASAVTGRTGRPRLGPAPASAKDEDKDEDEAEKSFVSKKAVVSASSQLRRIRLCSAILASRRRSAPWPPATAASCAISPVSPRRVLRLVYSGSALDASSLQSKPRACKYAWLDSMYAYIDEISDLHE
jgi:hypothetical protein